jgi:hypothetical protein
MSGKRSHLVSDLEAGLPHISPNALSQRLIPFMLYPSYQLYSIHFHSGSHSNPETLRMSSGCCWR